MSLYKLENIIQPYSWGSKTAFNQWFGIENPNGEPQAELWMGAHANGCSRDRQTGTLLSDCLLKEGRELLGEYTYARFGQLPYLFKVLAVDAPLSIQVHPNKNQAEAGFKKENAQNISINAAHRNYKDDNHKPELIYALTFYKAMNGFRPVEQIVSLFRQTNITELTSEVDALAISPNSKGLETFFYSLMSLSEERKIRVFAQLDVTLAYPARTFLAREAFEFIAELKQHYRHDIGLLAPLYLNTIELAPGEAMFLHSQTLHAYVKGIGLEIMANSDNVLRAGLTPKHIDVPELIKNTRFSPMSKESIKLQSIDKDGKKTYPIPVDDFSFDVIHVNQQAQQQFLRGPELLFCVEGEIDITDGEQYISLMRGESVFIGNDSKAYQYSGHGTLARAYN